MVLAVDTRYAPSIFGIVLLIIFFAYGCNMKVFTNVQQLAPQVLTASYDGCGFIHSFIVTPVAPGCHTRTARVHGVVPAVETRYAPSVFLHCASKDICCLWL